MLMTMQTPYGGSFAGKTVLVTGHTGFKGAWLTLWLHRLGAKVIGYALVPPTTPSLYEEARLAEFIVNVEADIRDRAQLVEVMAKYQPDIVFHLAAQPLVRLSYREPAETYEVNVMGTVNVLEAVRQTSSVRACVVVTSDKCYDNREWAYGYRENDAMGGFDPYSSSKGCAELVTSAYRNSFFSPENGVGIATVRAGNVIGGGDWAEDRIVPDIVRALEAGEPVPVRNPGAVRPWQHVMEPLSGYLWLAARLVEAPATHAEGWNFGPKSANCVPVARLVEIALARWGTGAWQHPDSGNQPHEAHYLKLDITKATTMLGWEPLYDLDTTLACTMDWYAERRKSDFDAQAYTLQQIADYERSASQRGAVWNKIEAR